VTLKKSGLHFLSFALTTALVVASSSLAGAQTSPQNSNLWLLGSTTYKTMPLYKLKSPIALWMDQDLLLSKKIALPSDSLQVREQKMLNLVGYASKVDGEIAPKYTSVWISGLVDSYGGKGLNTNLGSGRAAIIPTKGEGDWQLKGSGKTMMVNEHSDDDSHRSGASGIGEGVWEAAWSALLYNELPYGAYRLLGVFATNSSIPQGDDAVPRIVAVREDPLRPAHFVINTDALVIQPEFEKKRVARAMKQLVEALPKPVGYVSRGRVEAFKAGVAEFIHRQAVQNGYIWAHSMIHGGIVPANTGLDGRTLDFGTFSAFDGYPNVTVITEEGFDNNIKSDLLKNIRDSWVQTLPANLLAVLPSEQEMFDSYERDFQNTRRVEMLRLAGAFTELTTELQRSGEGDELARVLIQIAEAGNERQINIWNEENPYGKGTYKLGKTLVALAAMPVSSLSANQPELLTLLPDQVLLQRLVRAYKKTFTVQRKLALEHGISNSAEKQYRVLAAKIRNAKMPSMYRNGNAYHNIDKMVELESANLNGQAFAKLVNGMVSRSRREFWDAEPFTIVLKENAGRREGEKVRRVFDARAGQISNVAVKTMDVAVRNALENRQKFLAEIYSVGPSKTSVGVRCVDLFAN
jgi:hypothetical protein